MNDVILFLTSPATPERQDLSLTNLRQLKKLGKDIIVMSTCPNISQEYYELASLVIFDFYKGVIDKQLYVKANNYPVPYTKPHGSFFYNFVDPRFIVYTNTHFLSVFRNTKNLITLAYALNYKNFLYIEDDHYFSDFGLTKLQEYFDRINHENLNAIYFTNIWDSINTSHVIHSYFWFGNSHYFNESVVDNLPENHDELESQFPETCDYETFLYSSLYNFVYNKHNVVLESVKESGFISIFGADTKINQIYSHYNLADDSRINILEYKEPNLYKLILNLKLYDMHDDFTYVRVFKNDELLCGVKLKLKEIISVVDLNLDLNKPTNLKVMFDSNVVKEFKNLTKDNVAKNGKWLDD